MTTISHPAKGNNGFTEAGWASLFGAIDGIYDDRRQDGQYAFHLTRINASNIARIRAHPAGALVNGYRLEVTVDHDLPVPTSAGTYRIYVRYDPALNVADGSGNASTQGPCRLVLLSGTGAPDSSGGEKYLHLWTIVRAASQQLTDATVVDLRSWVGTVSSGAETPPFGEGSTAPRGSFRFKRFEAGSLIEVREHDSELDALVWMEVGAAKQENGGADLPVPAAMTGGAYYYLGPNNHVHLRGEIRRANGQKLAISASADVLLATLPNGYRPGTTYKVMAYSGGNAGGIARIWIDTNGEIRLKPGLSSADVDFVNLDMIPSFKGYLR